MGELLERSTVLHEPLRGRQRHPAGGSQRLERAAIELGRDRRGLSADRLLGRLPQHLESAAVDTEHEHRQKGECGDAEDEDPGTDTDGRQTHGGRS